MPMGFRAWCLCLGAIAGFAQDTRSLLNDLRSISFPPSAGQAGGASGAGAGVFGGGAPFGTLLGAGGAKVGGGAASLPTLPPIGGSGSGFGAGIPPPLQQHQQQMISQNEVMLPPDMGCSEIKRAPLWARAKTYFRDVYGEQGTPPFQVAARSDVQTVLSTVMTELQAEQALSAEASEECGFGKFFLQLSSIFNSDDLNAITETLRGFEQVISPVLTILLDIPWAGTAQSSWPFFGLFAQLSLRKQQEAPTLLNDLETDGLQDPLTQQYYTTLANAAPSMDITTMVEASAAYLDAVGQNGGILPFFTAMAAQAAVAPLDQRLQALTVIQRAFKRSIQDAGGLEVALSTRWPLWTFLHIAITPLAVSGS